MLHFAEASAECIISEKMPAETLKEMEHLDTIPDNMLCLYKCIFEKIGLVDEEHKIHGEDYNVVPGMPELEEAKSKELIECLNKIGKVEMCEDIKKVDKCYDSFVPA